MPAIDVLASDSFDGDVTYADAVHIVHIHVVEPHPLRPDASPYNGRISENEFSCPQPRSYEERRLKSEEVEALHGPNQLQLVDEFANPVWCTYGPAANAAFLIDQTGVVRLSQLWADADEIRLAIDEMLGR